MAGHVRHFKGIDFYSERNRVYGGFRAECYALQGYSGCYFKNTLKRVRVEAESS